MPQDCTEQVRAYVAPHLIRVGECICFSPVGGCICSPSDWGWWVSGGVEKVCVDLMTDGKNWFDCVMEGVDGVHQVCTHGRGRWCTSGMYTWKG